MRVMVVDDDEFIVELLYDTLRLKGATDVVCFTSPADAVDYLEEGDHSFDCILLDIQMPEVTGIDLCAVIRNIDHYEDTPIVMITAMQDKRFINEAFSAGANDYIAKPFDITDLDIRLKRAISLYRKPLHHVPIDQDDVSESSAAIPRIQPSPDIAVGPGRLCDEFTFLNYFWRLARCGAPHHLFAVNLSDVASDATIGEEELRSVLNAVMKAIDKFAAGQTYLVQYRGNGVFVVLLQSSARGFDSSVLAAGFRHVVRGLLPVDPVLTIGEPVRVSRFQTEQIHSIYKNAVSLAGFERGFAPPHSNSVANTA